MMVLLVRKTTVNGSRRRRRSCSSYQCIDGSSGSIGQFSHFLQLVLLLQCFRIDSITNKETVDNNINNSNNIMIGIKSYVNSLSFTFPTTSIQRRRRTTRDTNYHSLLSFTSPLSFAIFAAPKRGDSRNNSSSNNKKGKKNDSNSNRRTTSKITQKVQKKRSTNTMLQHQTDMERQTDDIFSSSDLKAKKSASSTNHKKQAPPWNVRSTNDAKIHVEQEKIRRATIQQQQRLQQQQQQLQHLKLNDTGVSDTSTTTISFTDTTSNTDSATSPSMLLSKTFLTTKERQFIKWKRFSRITGGMKVLHTFYNVTTLQSTLQNGKINYGVPEIAFIGRSNVGKSSLLNTLYTSLATSSIGGGSSSNSNNPKRKSTKDTNSITTSTTMARVGKTPGATASVNMYSLYNANNKKHGMPQQQGQGQQKDMIIFTDLPGFGYAKLSKERQESIIRTTEQYIYSRTKVSQTLALGIVLLDIRRIPTPEDIEFIETLYNMNVSILIVITKCDKISSKYERQQLITNIQSILQLPQTPLCISSKTGENISLLWQIIFDACDTCINQMKQKYDTVPSNDDTDRDEDYDDNEDDDDDEYNENNDVWYNGDKSNAVSSMNYDDDDRIEYNQGYDWTNDDIVLEDESDVYYNGNDAFNNDNTIDDDDTENINSNTEEDDNDDELMPIRKRVTLKTLKRRVKKMQRRGEI